MKAGSPRADPPSDAPTPWEHCMSPPNRSQQLKRYRSLYAAAKRKGLVKGDKDARSFVPSGYMKTKLNKLGPYLNENYAALKVSPQMARLYRDAPSDIVPAVSGNRVLIRNEPGYRALVRRGIPMRIRKLKSGEHEFVPLPIKPTSPEDLMDVVTANPVFNQLKYESEKFAFKLNTFPSYDYYPDLESLAYALMNNYESLDPTKTSDADENFATLEIYRTHVTNWRWDKERIEHRRKKARERQERRMGRMDREEREEYLADIAEKRKRSRGYKRQLEKLREQRAARSPEQVERDRVKAREAMRRKRAKDRGES